MEQHEDEERSRGSVFRCEELHTTGGRHRQHGREADPFSIYRAGTIIQTKVLPGQATVFVWPCSPAAGLPLLHLLLLLHLLPPSSWPRPAGARAETAGNPHRPLPTLSCPTPGRRTPRTPARRERGSIISNRANRSGLQWSGHFTLGLELPLQNTTLRNTRVSTGNESIQKRKAEY